MSTETLYEKIWKQHVVEEFDDGSSLLFIDRHIVQEVSSPQAFAYLRQNNLKLANKSASIAVADHAVPTKLRAFMSKDSPSAKQIAKLLENCRDFEIPYIGTDDVKHGIVHVIGPELGFTLPGVTLVCGDSHTSTHGAFGAIAFGIGATECACVFATQALRQKKLKTMRVNVEGELPHGVTVKDIILALISKIGTHGGVGYSIEYAGDAIKALSMEARMTLCNMTIEAGSRVGLVAPDDTTFAYVKGRPLAPGPEYWSLAVAEWRGLRSDTDARFDREVSLDVADLAPQVSWGTNPGETVPVTGQTPDPLAEPDETKRKKILSSLSYMGLKPGSPLIGTKIDKVFIGSCTNGRLEDLRAASVIVKGHRVAPGITALIVPGSATVKQQAEAEGLDVIFIKAGFEWRDAGCSMCVAMNDDRLSAGERCASTSNRNFEGRQGQGGRTHLMSPAMAAAAALAGKIVDVRQHGRAS